MVDRPEQSNQSNCKNARPEGLVTVSNTLLIFVWPRCIPWKTARLGLYPQGLKCAWCGRREKMGEGRCMHQTSNIDIESGNEDG